jgi:hypothetical protein
LNKNKETTKEIIMDSEEIKKKKPDDFPSIITKSLLEVDWFLYLIILIAFLVVISDIFIQKVLQNIHGAFKGDEITTWGHIIQALGLLTIIIVGKVTKNYL